MHGDKLNITSLAVAICTLIPAVSTADDSVAEALEQSGVHGGLVVVVGCEAPDVLTDLSRRGPYLVHGLDTRQGRVERAREQILGQGLVGRVSVSTWDGKRLPFVDNVVNLVLVQDSTVSLEEIDCRRVLAPGGWVAARHAADSDLGFDRMGDWFVYHEAMPEALDSWGHHMYDSSGIGAGNDRTVGPRVTCNGRRALSSREVMKTCPALASSSRTVDASIRSWTKARWLRSTFRLNGI
jgi:hypothetical protein